MRRGDSRAAGSGGGREGGGAREGSGGTGTGGRSEVVGGGHIRVERGVAW